MEQLLAHKRKKWIVVPSTLALVSVVAVETIGLCAAASPTFGQKILPMDCVFETINDGTGTLHYLTPAACGIVVGPSPSEPDTPVVLPQPATDSGTAPPTLIANVPAAVANNTPATTQLPWQQIVTQNAATTHPAVSTPTHVNGVVVASAAVGILALLGLAVFLI